MIYKYYDIHHTVAATSKHFLNVTTQGYTHTVIYLALLYVHSAADGYDADNVWCVLQWIQAPLHHWTDGIIVFISEGHT